MNLKITAFLIFLSLGTFAQVEAPSNDSSTKNTLEEVECSGNTLTECEIIRREIYIREGELIDEEEIQNAKIRLQLTGLFQKVDVFLKKGSSRGRVKVVVEVQETSPIFTETVLSLASYQSPYSNFRIVSLNGSIGVGTRNFLGRGMILKGTLGPGLKAESADDQAPGRAQSVDSSIQLIIPHLFGAKKFFSEINLTNYTLETVIESRDYQSGTKLTQNQFALTGSLGYRLFDFSYASTGASLQCHNIGNYLWCHRIYSLEIGRNTLNDPYFPTEGSNLYGRLTAEHSNDTLAGTVGPILGFRKIWSLTESHLIDLNLTGVLFTHFSKVNEMGYDINTFLNYNYQWKRHQFGESIQSGRWFAGLALKDSYQNYNSDSPSVSRVLSPNGVNAGVEMDTKSLGYIKFVGTYYGPLWSGGGK